MSKLVMDNLFNIFEREKQNNPDFTVYYRKEANSIQYSNDTSALTVLFNPNGKEGCEEFYFKPNKYDDGIGQMVLRTMEYGRLGVSDNYIIADIPREFREIAQRYQFDRDSIGVEKTQEEKKMKKTDFER